MYSDAVADSEAAPVRALISLADGMHASDDVTVSVETVTSCAKKTDASSAEGESGCSATCSTPVVCAESLTDTNRLVCGSSKGSEWCSAGLSKEAASIEEARL